MKTTLSTIPNDLILAAEENKLHYMYFHMTMKIHIVCNLIQVYFLEYRQLKLVSLFNS